MTVSSGPAEVKQTCQIRTYQMTSVTIMKKLASFSTYLPEGPQLYYALEFKNSASTLARKGTTSTLI